jgi:hypothetical protein
LWITAALDLALFGKYGVPNDGKAMRAAPGCVANAIKVAAMASY